MKIASLPAVARNDRTLSMRQDGVLRTTSWRLTTATIISLLLCLAFFPCAAKSQTDEALGRYSLIYDSTYIWPDGHGGYDYIRKFVSDVVLDKQGRSVLSRPATPVLDKDDKITITAYTKLSSGEILQADTSDMVTRILPGDRRWVFINFRRAEPGAILHLDWLINSKQANIAGKRFLGRTVPVERAIVALTVPEAWRFNFAFTGSGDAHQVETIRPSSGEPPSATYSWIANDLAGLSHEDYAPPVERMIPCLYFSFSYDTNWSGPDSNLIDWKYLARLYFQQIKTFTKQSSQLNAVADSIGDRTTDSEKRTEMAYAWAGDHFKPLDSDITLGGSINEVLQLGRGNQAEAAVILLALLERLKIPCSAYLVASKDAGDPLIQLPALFWFDRLLIAAYPKTDTIWIDPFYQLADMDILPFEDQGAKGLSLSGAGGDFITIPMPDYRENGKAIHLKLDLDSLGSLHGQATEIYSGALIPEVSIFLKGQDALERQAPWEKKLAQSFPGAKIEKFDVYPPDSTGRALKIGYSFNTGPTIRPFANRAYIPMDLLGRWSDLPALPGNTRQFPIELRRPRFE
ncbi:MAG TPA: hypothetical protein DEO84_08640, partial [candidate division Zixibacteria bacterium]|nr:hypothetical protein [candidate division Zixibacteria bacterium]